MISNLIGRPLMYGIPAVSGHSAYDYQYPPVSTFSRYNHKKRKREKEEEEVYKKPKFTRRKRMPYKGRLRYGRRRKVYRRKFARRKKAYIGRTITPRSKVITAKVVKGPINFSNVTINVSGYNVSCNDITDPFGSSGTEQPLGFDQWATLYNKAKVIGSKIVVKYHNKASQAVMVGITRMERTDQSFAATTYDRIMETPYTKSQLLSPDVDHTMMSHTFSARKHLQVSNVKDDNDQEIDLATPTGPTKNMEWLIWAQPVDQTTSSTVEAVVTVYYTIILYDPQLPSRSTA